MLDAAMALEGNGKMSATRSEKLSCAGSLTFWGCPKPGPLFRGLPNLRDGPYTQLWPSAAQRPHFGWSRSHLTLAVPQPSHEDRSFRALGLGRGTVWGDGDAG